MKQRYIPITVIVAILAALAVAGGAMPEQAQVVPARTVMDNNGGRVIFSHRIHADEYGFECADCHHDDIGQERPVSCGSCHPKAFDETFRSEHFKAFSSEDACLRCHDDVPGETLAEEDRPDTGNIPLRADAFHAQCMDCHEENGGPYGAESCYQCHAR
ncbi:cytochrome c3 family protein [Pseudodesulfovibrio senegalensis]|uniref:Cytochrome c3 family protein n=1 Tax=Pseudodesulfovibrio senegalensis TaxID=1721087 RepID=A0A6N6N4M3_9BACT|nr:cytochrome c3 family protein [Pseudodesulfovibrio senegalensis]KAB1442168.1 cytochrome c3 family protein [Pseudodesulfovibrio senegalensis]